MLTRRTFLRTLFGAGVGCLYFRYLPLGENRVNLNLPQASPIHQNDQVSHMLQTPQTPQIHYTQQTLEVPATKPRHLPVSSRVEAAPFSTRSVLANAANYTGTPTYDHSGQAVHPSVIDFKTEFGLDSWGGFRYWMAFTPYPDFNYALENPSLLVSTDGMNWRNPPGIRNPVAPKPMISLFAIYNSDPELVYDPVQNILMLYWREYQRNGYEKIWVKKIDLNYNQSAKILCLENKWQHGGNLALSPTVWRQNLDQWYMWTTNGATLMLLSRSKDGIFWGPREPCSTPWDTWNGGYIPWHVAAKPDYTGQKIDFLIAGWPIKGTLYSCELFYATAPMSQPANLSMPLQKPLLKAGSKNRWDGGFIYRSSFVREAGDKPHYRIWYSACSNDKTWHIGYTEGSLADVSVAYL